MNIKKNFLRILCRVLTFAMLFAFAGCNKEDTPDEPTPPDNVEEEGTGEGEGEGEGGEEELPPEETDPFAGLSKKEVQSLHVVDFITFRSYYELWLNE